MAVTVIGLAGRFPLYGAERFDAEFFGVRAARARTLDPQHRALLTCLWQALDSAGPPLGPAVRVGVFVAGAPSGYLEHRLAKDPVLGARGLDPRLLLDNDRDYLATRAGLWLTGRGARVTVEHSAPDALAALRAARAALEAGECDLAVTGAVRIDIAPDGTPSSAPSPSPTSASVPVAVPVAVPGHADGCGVVLLQREEDARREGAPLLALLREQLPHTLPGADTDTDTSTDAGERDVAAGMSRLLAEVAGLERGERAEARLVRLAPPAPPRPNAPAGPWRFVLSAREHGLLRRAAEELIGVLRARPGIRADDLARTLAERERQRVAVDFTARDLGEVRAALTEFLITGTVEADPAQGTPDPVALRHARRVTLPPRPLDETRYWAGPPPLPTGPRPAPEDTPIEVLRMLRTQLGDGDLGMHDEFEAVGGDPALAAQAAAAVSARFSAPLTGPDVLTLGSAARIAAHLEPDAPRVPRRVSVLTRLRAGTPGRDVFLVHPAGGNVFCYHNLLRHSREPGTVWGLGFPADRLRELRTVPALTRAYVQAIRRVRPRGPYLLGGYSFGGVVAFEMARTLQAQGERVDNLLLMDVPQPVTRPPAGEREFLAAVPELARCVLSLEPAAMEPPADFDAAVELLRRPEWSETVAEEYRRVLRILWLNYRALSGYRWRDDGTLRAPATLLRAGEPTPALLRRLGVETGRTDLWAERFEPAPRLLDVPGDHYSMFHDAAHLRTLAARFDEALALRPVAVSPVR